MKCAGASCQAEAIYYRNGSLHYLDLPAGKETASRRHLVWLCRSCSTRFTVESWRPPGEQLQLRRQQRAFPVSLQVPVRPIVAAARKLGHLEKAS